MILTCPACATRYRVADQEFEGSRGRTVRCNNCGYLWHEAAPAQPTPETVEPPAAPAGIGDAISEEPASAAGAATVPQLEIPPDARSRPSRVRSLASRRALIAVLIVAAAIAWVFVRGHFAADHPSTAPPPATADQPAPTARLASGLVIRKVTPARTADGLVVDGEIANPSNVPRDVPRLRVSLQDAAAKEVQSETVDPPKARLGPGEVVHFQASFVHPPDAATGVVVTFASS